MSKEQNDPIERIEPLSLSKRKTPDFNKAEEAEREIPLVVPIWQPLALPVFAAGFFKFLSEGVGRVTECMNANLLKERKKHEADLDQDEGVRRKMKAMRRHMERASPTRCSFLWTDGRQSRYK